MTLLEKLKGLFARDEVPDEAKAIFAKAKTQADVLRGLDNLITRNEMEAKELNDEIANVEETASAEEEKIRDGSLRDREKRSTLLHIKRLRKQMDLYESRLRIYERNMDLLQTLMGKIQQMEAMRLSGVDESRIDQIAMEFDEKREKYEDLLTASHAHESATMSLSSREDRELSQLEAEITGLGKEPEKEAAEKALAREEETPSRPSQLKAPPAKEKEAPPPLTLSGARRVASRGVEGRETEMAAPEGAAAIPRPIPVLPPRRPIDDDIDRELAKIEAEAARDDAEAAAGRRKKVELE